MDIFATKGTEYLIVLAYLALLVVVAWSLRAGWPWRPSGVTSSWQAASQPARAWFHVPDGLHYHRGHTWALPGGEDVFLVGMDDFAQKLLGKPGKLLLPGAGQRLEQGKPGWRLELHGRTLDLLSPLSGEVVETNGEAARNPGVVCEDPYQRGWLLKVRVPQAAVALKNLLPAGLARAWTEQAAGQLSAMMGSELGVVLADGGVPISGFARELAGERWHQVAVELLLSE